MARGAAHALGSAEDRTPAVLIVDDEPELVRMLRRMIESEGFRVYEASDRSGVASETVHEPELVLLDLQLGDASGVDVIADIRQRSPDSVILVMTGFATIDSAVACMRAGAFDYLEKPFDDRVRVAQTLQRALEHRALRVRNRELEGELDRRSALEGIVFQSPAMQRVVQKVQDLEQNESNVLIQAESGTGKELIARAIHMTSPGREGPFVPVDCGALPGGIIESELFGYEAGAFTGAVRPALGLFRSADGGTLFLDEVGELPLLLQSKLLRVIQEREVRPLGATDPVPVDVRIVAASNRDLEQEVQAGRFRSDLFYRLRVVSIQLPPLRERPEDIPLLALHFLKKVRGSSPIRGMEPAAMEALTSQPWRGNVRELENCIEGSVALARGPYLSVADLGLNLDSIPVPRVTPPSEIPLSLAAYERRCLEDALSAVEGDVRRAAALLGIGRSTLYRKMGEHKLR